jgi:osmotically-inducible protein OsmY
MEDLQPRAQAALVNSPFYELRGLQVQERGRTLLISGCVTSFYHKQLAQEVVRSVCSDTEVINTIRVKGEEEAVPQSPLPPT